MARLTKVERYDRANTLHRFFFDGNLPPHVGAKLLEQAVEHAGKLALWYWWKMILPKHFERPAHSRYDYQQRSARYIKWKVRRYPQSRGLDLIMSGKLKQIALSEVRSQPRVIRRMRGFEFRIGVRTTDYVSKNKYVNMHQELIAMDQTDFEELSLVLRDLLEIGLGYKDVPS